MLTLKHQLVVIPNQPVYMRRIIQIESDDRIYHKEHEPELKTVT